MTFCKTLSKTSSDGYAHYLSKAARHLWLGTLLGSVVLAGAFQSACITAGPHTETAPKLEARDAKSGDVSYASVRGTWLRTRFIDDSPSRSRNAPEKAPIVFVHGYGSRLESWRVLQPALSEGRKTLSYDQRGFGLSERPEGEYGPASHADDLAALIEQFELEKPIIVAHSYGGGVALKTALEHPESVGGIVLVDAFAMSEQVPPTFRWAQIPGVGEFLFGALFKEVPGEKYMLAFNDRGRFVSVAALDEVHRIMEIPGTLYSALATVRGMRYGPDEARYNKIRIPILVVWGEQDRVTPLSQGKKLAAMLDAPLLTLPESGHMPSWERPDVLIEHIGTFVEEYEAKQSAEDQNSDLPKGRAEQNNERGKTP